jgi:hypothetical protein
MTKLFDQVLAFIREPEPARFDELGLAVFRYQAAHVPVYGAYLDALGIDAPTVRSIKEIPPVSTLAFKHARVEMELHPQSPAARVFLTSGTTIGRDERGRHLVPQPEIYRAAAIRHLGRMMFPDVVRLAMLALHPTADRMPESSLAQMISWCIEEYGDGSALCVATRESVNTAQAREFLRAMQRLNRQVCVLGTTAACAALYAALREEGAALRLPAGSRLMDTGGSKGQRMPLSPEQVVADAHELLGIEPALVINEYGMTEMCSQLYDATSFNSTSRVPAGRRIKLAPPWLKPAALDPITLRPKPGGQPGVLAFFDLANVGSISALMTEDVGIVRDDTVMVLGRAAADLRGCALAIQQFAESEERWSSSQPPIIAPWSAPVLAAQAQADWAGAVDSPLSPVEIDAAAGRLRRTLATAPSPIDPPTIGAVFSEVVEAMSTSGRWRRATREIAAGAGFSESLLRVALRALVNPLRDAAEFARKLRPRRELLGFIMPGNVPGAGTHELVTALIAGCAAIVKTSYSEPVFFNELAASLRELDSRFGSDFAARLEVFSWPRERANLTDALLKNCDRVIAFGDDATLVQLEGLASHGRLLAFGSRFSGAVVMREALPGIAMKQTADALALDCAMFEQRGCLSPHHIFVEQHAREFAAQLAAAFSGLNLVAASDGGVPRLDLQHAAAIRTVRETARWRRLGGADVELWEDPDFHWTVIFDDGANFTSSPGFRTMFVSSFNNPSDLARRLEPVRGRIEAFAIAAGQSPAHDRIDSVRATLERCGATHICGPGEMQSAPLEWPHSGGEFLRLFIG